MPGIPESKQQFDHKLAQLTRAQKPVLDLFVQGYRDNVIADSLGIKPNSVRSHIRNIANLLGIPSDSSDRVFRRQEIVRLFRTFAPERVASLHYCDEPLPISTRTLTAPEPPIIIELEAVDQLGRNDHNFVGRLEAINPEPAKRHYREDLSNKPKQNLSRHENEFIGRHKELCKLMEYLSPDKSISIIAIDGIAGVGKTALALEAAWLCLEYREYAEESPNYSRRSNSECNIPLFDAIIFTSAKEDKLSYDGTRKRLTGQRTLQEIYRTISETLDTPAIMESHQQEQFNQVIKSLKQQKTLLIIDNLETIHREERERVMSFLHDLPMGVKALITTREQLGYTPIRLSSLEEIDAKALMYEFR